MGRHCLATVSPKETAVRILLAAFSVDLDCYCPWWVDVFVAIIRVSERLTCAIHKTNDEIESSLRVVRKHPQIGAVICARWIIIWGEARTESECITNVLCAVIRPIIHHFLQGPIEPQQVLGDAEC